MKTVPEMLREGADTYEERNKVYGDNYKRHGEVMHALFPEGVNLVTLEDHNRFGILTQMVAKLARYCQNWNVGGHEDSLHDLMVYTPMLQELDGELREYNEILKQEVERSEYDPEDPLVLDEQEFMKDLNTNSGRHEGEPGIPYVISEDILAELTEEELASSGLTQPSPPVVIPEETK